MDCKTKKYLHIYDWNYWWGYYRCGKDWDPFDAAEFSLSEDEAGEAPFFHFDFHNLSALHQTIRDGEFVEPDNPDHPHFLEQARRLRSGEQDRTGSSGRCTIRFFHRRCISATPPSGAASR